MSFEKANDLERKPRLTSSPEEEIDTANLGARPPAISTDQPEEDAGGPARPPDPVEPNGAGPTRYTNDPLEK